MILVDTSVWIHFFDRGIPALNALLLREEVVAHPFVIGEFAMGTPRNRNSVLADLADLPQAVVAHHDEIMQFILAHRLFGLGIGFIDAHLLASAKLTPGTSLWTRDLRLQAAATRLGLAYKRPRTA